MERVNWRSDELFLTSMLLGVSSHIMYLLSTGRNAWYGVWSERYKGPTSLHFSLTEAQKKAQTDRVQGTVFTIEQVPVLAFRCRTGIAYCTEFHSQESFKMLDWDDDMDFLKIGAAMPMVMTVFSNANPLAWQIPCPNENSFVTRVFDLVGNVDPTSGKTSPLEPELLDHESKLSKWKSHSEGSRYYMSWEQTETDRLIASVEKVINRFNSLSSPQLKLAANGLFVSAENFVKCHFEENWISPDLEFQAAMRELAISYPDLFPQTDE